MSERTLPVVRLVAEALRRESVKIVDVKTNALLVDVGTEKYMIGVQKCK